MSKFDLVLAAVYAVKYESRWNTMMVLQLACAAFVGARIQSDVLEGSSASGFLTAALPRFDVCHDLTQLGLQPRKHGLTNLKPFSFPP